MFAEILPETGGIQCVPARTNDAATAASASAKAIRAFVGSPVVAASIISFAVTGRSQITALQGSKSAAIEARSGSSARVPSIVSHGSASPSSTARHARRCSTRHSHQAVQTALELRPVGDEPGSKDSESSYYVPRAVLTQDGARIVIEGPKLRPLHTRVNLTPEDAAR